MRVDRGERLGNGLRSGVWGEQERNDGKEGEGEGEV